MPVLSCKGFRKPGRHNAALILVLPHCTCILRPTTMQQTDNHAADTHFLEGLECAATVRLQMSQAEHPTFRVFITNGMVSKLPQMYKKKLKEIDKSACNCSRRKKAKEWIKQNSTIFF